MKYLRTKTKFIMLTLFMVSIVPWATFAKTHITPITTKSIIKINVFGEKIDTKFSTVQDSILSIKEEPLQFGTGFFIDYKGCAMTTAHVLLKQPAVLNPYKRFTISIASNISKKPDITYDAKIKYLDVSKDIGILCAENTKGKIFHPLDLASVSEIKKLYFGDDIYALGYPAMGGDSISYTTGTIMGFWTEPDLLSFLGIDFSKELSLIKVNASAGPGGSGTPLFSKQGNVLGIIFAGSNKPGGTLFAIDSTNIYKSLEKEAKRLRTTNEIPTDCVRDSDLELYRQAGIEYYDNKCKVKRNIKTENLISINYTARCNAKLSITKIINAGYTIESTNSTLDNWWNYLTELCPIDLKN